jgi:hypothetical protein
MLRCGSGCAGNAKVDGGSETLSLGRLVVTRGSATLSVRTSTLKLWKVCEVGGRGVVGVTTSSWPLFNGRSLLSQALSSGRNAVVVDISVTGLSAIPGSGDRCTTTSPGRKLQATVPAVMYNCTKPLDSVCFCIVWIDRRPTGCRDWMGCEV